MNTHDQEIETLKKGMEENNKARIIRRKVENCLVCLNKIIPDSKGRYRVTCSQNCAKIYDRCANHIVCSSVIVKGYKLTGSLETAQKLKLAHDNEIAKLKFEKLKFLEDFIIVNDNEKLFIPNKFLITDEISKLKSELK